MSDKSVMTARQAAELDFAFERNGWNSADVKLLSQGSFLTDILSSLRGKSTVVMPPPVTKNIVDLNAAPFEPNGLTLVSHAGSGLFDCGQDKVTLWLSPDQQDGKTIVGSELLKQWQQQRVMNANVLDYWLANPHLIPKECEGKSTFFPGTIYCLSGGSLCVRCLYRNGSQWYWNASWLVLHWDDQNPALVRAS